MKPTSWLIAAATSSGPYPSRSSSVVDAQTFSTTRLFASHATAADSASGPSFRTADFHSSQRNESNVRPQVGLPIPRLFQYPPSYLGVVGLPRHMGYGSENVHSRTFFGSKVGTIVLQVAFSVEEDLSRRNVSCRTTSLSVPGP